MSADPTSQPSTEPEQPPLETDDWPQPKPGIWPSIMVLGREVPVRSVTQTFTGNVELSADTPEEVDMAALLDLGQQVWLHVEGIVVGKQHKLVKGAPHGFATVSVTAAVRADREGALKMAADNESMRRVFENARDIIRELNSFLAADPPAENEVATPPWEAKQRARYFLESTRWVPAAKRLD